MVTVTYLQRVRQVLRSQLIGKNKVWATNTYSHHNAWGVHLKSSTLKMSPKWNEGGRTHIREMTCREKVLCEFLRQHKPDWDGLDPSPKGGSGRYQDILIMVGKGLAERQQKCTDQGSTRTEYKSAKAWKLPNEACFKVHPMQRIP